MIRVRLIDANGRIVEADAAPGARLLDVARAHGLPLEGTCEGQLACATCHVVVDAVDFARLRCASEEEEEMLDLVPNASRHSRLACQVVLGDGFGSIGVWLPSPR